MIISPLCYMRRSLKKQYVRLLKLVQSYAVISVGVKISLITMDKVRAVLRPGITSAVRLR